MTNEQKVSFDKVLACSVAAPVALALLVASYVLISSVQQPGQRTSSASPDASQAFLRRLRRTMRKRYRKFWDQPATT